MVGDFTPYDFIQTLSVQTRGDEGPVEADETIGQTTPA